MNIKIYPKYMDGIMFKCIFIVLWLCLQPISGWIFFHLTAFFSLCLEQEADLMELDNYEFVQFFLEVIEISLLAVW